MNWLKQKHSCDYFFWRFCLISSGYKYFTKTSRKSLQFARGKDYDISEEFDELSKQIEKKAVARVATGWTTTIRRIFSSAFFRPFSCVGILFLIQQWGEFSNLMIHMIEIFRDSNLTVVEPTLAPVIVGSVQVK